MRDKQAALEAIKRMPEEISLKEISREIEFLAAIREGEEQADEGKVIPLAQLEKNLKPGQILVGDFRYEDLAGLVGFIARDNQTAAEHFGLALIGKLKLLQDHPRLGRVVPERGDPNLREIIHHPYRIVYRIHEQDSVIEVLRFWHGARGEPDVQITP